ncbi:mobilization protein [Salmonella enterica subsp. enterica serovar Chester]|nr:mobilization protein [Salmonella enterica subsp. enterica serovar Chester]
MNLRCDGETMKNSRFSGFWRADVHCAACLHRYSVR